MHLCNTILLSKIHQIWTVSCIMYAFKILWAHFVAWATWPQRVDGRSFRNVAELSTNSVPMKTDKIQQEAPKEDFHFNAKNTSSLSCLAFNSVGTAMLKIFPYPVFTRLLMNKLQPTANHLGWFKTLLVQRVSPSNSMAEEPTTRRVTVSHFPKVVALSGHRLVQADDDKCHEPTEVNFLLFNWPWIGATLQTAWGYGALFGWVWWLMANFQGTIHRFAVCFCNATLMLATIFEEKAILLLHSPVLDLDNLRSNVGFSKMFLWNKPRCFVDFVVRIGKPLPSWCFLFPVFVIFIIISFPGLSTLKPLLKSPSPALVKHCLRRYLWDIDVFF